MKCFKAGGFTVKFNGGIGHAVALDEAHEMGINRDLKMAVVRPTQAYLQKTVCFFNYRVKAQKNLAAQIFCLKKNTPTETNSILDNTTFTKHWEENVQQIRRHIVQFALFTSKTEISRGLVNIFTGTHATLEQAHDMLNAKKVGQEKFKNYITHHILQQPSTVQAPLRHKRLLTMGPQKVKEVKLSQRLRDTNKFLRKRLAQNCSQR